MECPRVRSSFESFSTRWRPPSPRSRPKPAPSSSAAARADMKPIRRAISARARAGGTRAGVSRTPDRYLLRPGELRAHKEAEAAKALIANSGPGHGDRDPARTDHVARRGGAVSRSERRAL